MIVKRSRARNVMETSQIKADAGNVISVTINQEE